MIALPPDVRARFVNTGMEGPDGSFHRCDYRIEDRGSGRTAIRYVHSGMLGEDWEAEYEGMSEGDPMYLHKLVQYLTYFPGRYATSIDAHGPPIPDRAAAMAAFRRGLGLDDGVAEGDQVRLTPDGLPSIDGVARWSADVAPISAASSAPPDGASSSAWSRGSSPYARAASSTRRDWSWLKMPSSQKTSANRARP